MLTGSSSAGGRASWIHLASLLAALAAGSGCGRHHEAEVAAGRDVQATTIVATPQRIGEYVRTTGSLKAQQTVQISTRMMGWVRKIHVQEGQYVEAGAPLISIDDSDLRAKKAQVEAGIAEARAVLANAETMVARFENLFAEKSVSKQQLDDVMTGRDRAAAGLAAALARRQEVEVQLGYVDIAAPVAGLVARKMIEEGDMASPGVPLLVLEDNERMKVIARLGEKDIDAVSPGDTVLVEVTSLEDAQYRTPLARVIPAADPGSRTYDIEAYVPNPEGRLKSGMFARVRVQVGWREAVAVPAASIAARGQLRGVFVVDQDSVVHLRWVRLGHAFAQQVEVLSGLKRGETIVLSAAVPLVEGDRVVPQP
jgi:RND family efflux transporter MFP subunit